MNDNAEWLSGLMPGSEVAVMSRGLESIVTVDRVTKTQIVVAHSKYRISDGRLIGGSSWDLRRIAPVTQEARDVIEHLHLRYTLIKYVESPDVTLDAMRAMWKAKKAQDTQP